MSLAAALSLSTSMNALAQPGQGRTWVSDPRAEDRNYLFADTNEDVPYCVFASSKISDDTPAPLIISLHGLGAPPQIMCNTTAVDLAEQGGYILASPMGYSTGGWYGAPTGGRGSENQPENLAELSEKDVMNVLRMVRDEFNVDEDRIYLTGHSMGGAGTLFLGSKHADIWAAIAPVAPAARRLSDDRTELLRRLKDAGVSVMIVHGDEDEAVSVESAREWVAAMEELDMEHEYVELPGVTHGPVITASQEHIYAFIGKHSK
jgi:predicted peptidase